MPNYQPEKTLSGINFEIYPITNPNAPIKIQIIYKIKFKGEVLNAYPPN